MKRYLRLAALGILLSPSVAKAADLDCTPENEVALRMMTARLVSGLHIGSYRADGALIQTNADELDRLFGERGTCSAPMKARLCDTECFYQRANVHLFRAQQMPLLSATDESPDDGIVNRGDLLVEVTHGLALVDEALGHAARQHGKADSTDKRQLPYNKYLKALGQLNALKAKLLLAAGDLLYRTASRSHLEQLNYQIAKALDDTSTPNGDKGTEYYKATTYYQEAHWLLVEARTSLPTDDMFDAELSTLALLEKDTSLRLESVRKGHLYLNIDPDDFTFRDISELGEKLNQQRRALDDQEKDVAQLLSQWALKYKNLKDQNFDQASAVHERAIDIEVHKLAQIQELAKGLTATVSAQINDLEHTNFQFELEQKIRAIQTGLNRSTSELKNDLVQLQAQTERDLFGLEKEGARDHVDQIRFQIDSAIAKYNFEMQRESLEMQKSELSNRIGADDDEIAIALNRQQQIKKRVELEYHRIALAKTLIDKARETRDEVLPAARGPIVHNICAVDAELAFYAGGGGGGYSDGISGESCSVPTVAGSKPALLDEICTARVTAARLSVEELAKVKGCLTGGDCALAGEAVSVVNALKQVKAKNDLVLKSQRDAWEKSVTWMNRKNTELVVIGGAATALRVYQQGVGALQTLAAAAAAIPDGDTGIIGIMPVKTFRIGEAAFRVANAVLEGFVRNAEWRYQDIQLGHQLATEALSNNERIDELKGMIATAYKQEELDKWNNLRAVAEVAVRASEIDKEGVDIANEAKLQTIQCKLDKGDMAATAGKLQAQRAGLEAQLFAQSKEIGLLAFDIEEQESNRLASQTEIARLGLEHTEIGLEIKKLERDRTNLRRMRDDVDRQISKVTGFESTVARFQSEHNAAVAVIGVINDKIEKTILNLNETQRSFVESVIQTNDGVALQQVAALRRQIDGDARVHYLERKVGEIEGAMRTAVAASRTKILGLVANAPTSEHEAIFWDFENLAAELTRGAPELLDYKRRLLENVNYTYNLYRNRYNMLAGLTNDVRPIDAEKPLFIGNSGELERLLADCASLGTNEICHPGSLAWSREGKNGFVSEFTVEKNSGLVQELVDQGRARFEISTYAQSPQDAKNLGQFVFWDPNKMGLERPMVLVHVVVGIQGSTCGTQEVMVRHLGSGVLFSKLASASDAPKPTLVVKRPMEMRLPVWSGGTYDTLASRHFQKFENGPFLIGALEAKLNEKDPSNNTVYPFVGYPLIGTYELVADANLARCLNTGAPTMKLGFVFLKN